MPGSSSQQVVAWRQRLKRRLVDYHGGSCIDCGYVGPAFMYDFDHRDPSTKSFGIGNTGLTLSYDRVLAESLKCDLVCANCHRMRTHRQRCPGCDYC